MRVGNIFLILMMLVTKGLGQSLDRKFAISASTAVQQGVWIYDKGTTDKQVANNQGYDFSHYRANLSCSLGLMHRFGKLKLGYSYTRRYFLEDEIKKNNDKYFHKQRYEISDGTVIYNQYGVSAEYAVIDKKKFTLSPSFEFGMFSINSTHPEKANFGRKTYFNIGVASIIHINRHDWVFKPLYTEMTILPKVKKNKNEKNRITSMGMQVSYRYWLK